MSCIGNAIVSFLELLVCESVTGRSTEAIPPALKSILSLHRCTLTLQQAALELFVCESVTGEVNGSHSTCAKKFSFSASLDFDVTPGSPLTAQ